MNKSHVWSIVLSILMIIVGLIAIIVPPIAGIAATLLFGWLLLIAGVVHLAFAWHRRGHGGVAWEVILGLLYLVIGFYVFWRPGVSLLALTLALGCYLLAEAIVEFILAFQLHGAKGSGWLWFDAIVNLILGFMIWRTWPFSSTWVIGTLVGIGILFTGFTRLVLAIHSHPKEAVPPPVAA